MSTNIDYDDISEANSFRRFLASAIDIAIVFLIRVFFAQVLMVFYLAEKMKVLAADYTSFFNTKTIDSPENLQFILNHAVFSDMILFVLALLVIGSLYYAFFNSSRFHATIGKRILSVEMLNSDYSKLSFLKALLIYFLSLAPVIFMLYIFSFSAQSGVTILQSMFSNIYHIILTVLIILLSGTYSMGFRRQPGFDIVFKVVLLNNKSNKAKLPWEKS